MKYVAILLSIAIVCIVGFITYTVYTWSQQGAGPATQTGPASVSHDVVLDGLTAFVRSSITADGLLVPRQQCADGACAPVLEDATTTTGYAIRTLINRANETGDDALRTVADQAIAPVLASCATDAEVCMSNAPGLEAYYAATGDERYRDALISWGPSTLAYLRTTAIGTEDLALSGMYERVETLYELTEDERYRDALVAAAEDVLLRWPDMLTTSDDSDEALYETNDVAVTLAMPFVAYDILLPAYRVTDDQRYLTPVLEFLNNADVESNLHAFRWEGGMAAVLRTAHIATETTRLAELPADERATAYDIARRIAASVILGQFDAEVRPLYTGSNDLLTGVYEVEAAEDLNYKHANLHAWMIDLLMQDDIVPSMYELPPPTNAI